MHNDTIPSLRASAGPSGRFVLRIDRGLHAALRGAAGEAGLSLNEYCARKLALPTGSITAPAAEVVARAAGQVGGALTGVIAFGSWARHDLSKGSDVDILIVVEPGFAIDRGVYRAWDEVPLFWDAHPVEPLFVHLPKGEDGVTGIWAEVAVEGVVLFERGLVVSRRLAEIRQRIVSGDIIRRLSHGQSYWVEVGRNAKR